MCQHVVCKVSTMAMNSRGEGGWEGSRTLSKSRQEQTGIQTSSCHCAQDPWFRTVKAMLSLKMNIRRRWSERPHVFMIFQALAELLCKEQEDCHSPWGWGSKVPQTGRLINNRNVLFAIPEAGSLRPRHQHGRFLVRTLFVVHSQRLLLCPHMVEGARELCGVSSQKHQSHS